MTRKRGGGGKRRRRLLKGWKQLGWAGKVWRVVWVALLAAVGFSFLQVLFCAFFNPITPLMVSRFFDQCRDPDREVRFERRNVSIEEVSPNLIDAVVYHEDIYFQYHRGFNIPQMKKSYLEGMKNGASTISMQTAKNCFLPHKRSIVRKAAEAYYTVLIEAVWGKKRIMEVYLNVAEFGDGIYGCEAACRHYFHHSSAHLTEQEAPLLVACLPCPLRRDPTRPSEEHRNDAAYVLRVRDKYGRVDLDVRREDLDPQRLSNMGGTLAGFLWWAVSEGDLPAHLKML